MNSLSNGELHVHFSSSPPVIDRGNGTMNIYRRDVTAPRLLNFDTRQCPPILENCVITVTDHFGLPVKRDILMNCKLLGAKVKQHFDDDCTHLIAKYQKGEAYEKACNKPGTIIVSLQWLEDCIQRRQYIKPYKPAVHYPLKDTNGIAGMHNLVISVTGFIGEERSDLKYLIKACGARYSGALSKKDNTHLICRLPEGEKFKKALEWKICVANRRWLYDCVTLWQKCEERLYKDIDVER